MHVQAGTVIGGSTLRSRPQVPALTIRAMLGRSSSQRSNTSEGSAQSSPMMATFAALIDMLPARSRRSAAGARAPSRPAPRRATPDDENQRAAGPGALLSFVLRKRGLANAIRIDK